MQIHRADLLWLGYAGFAAACFVILFTCAKLASGSITPFLFAFAMNFVNFLGHGAFVARARMRGRITSLAMPGSSLALFLCIGVIITINDTASVYMFKTGAPLSVAMPVFTAGNVFLTVLFGLVIMREKLALRQILGLVCIGAGIALLNV